MKKNNLYIFLFSIILLVGILFLNSTFIPNSGVIFEQVVSDERASDLNRELRGPGNRDPKRINSRNLNDHQWIKKFLRQGCQPHCLNYPLTVTYLTKHYEKLPLRQRPMANYIVERINENFRMANGKKVVNFYLKDVNRYGYDPRDDLAQCFHLFQLGEGSLRNDNGRKYTKDRWIEAFEDCDLLKDRKALNIYVYDAHDSDKGSDSTTGRGISNYENDYHAFILLDWNRLIKDYNNVKVSYMRYSSAQRPSTHEIGHALGLHHVCDNTASSKTSDTNFMASSLPKSIPLKNYYSVLSSNDDLTYTCPYQAGNRTLGMTSEQVIVVLESIVKQGQNWLERTYGGENL